MLSNLRIPQTNRMFKFGKILTVTGSIEGRLLQRSVSTCHNNVKTAPFLTACAW